MGDHVQKMGTLTQTTRRRRILFVSYTSAWKGPNVSLYLLLKYLHTIFDVAVLVPGNGPFHHAVQSLGIPVFSRKSLNKWSIHWILGLIRRENFDLIYGNSTSGSSRNALIAAKLARKPFVIHVRAMPGTWPRTRFISLRFVDAIIAVSHAVAAPLLRRRLGSKLHVVHNGVDVHEEKNTVPNLRIRHRQELGILDSQLLLIYVARINRVKSQELAIQLVSEATQLGVDVKLLLVGEFQDSNYTEHLRRLVSKLGLEDMVTLTGFRDDAHSLLHAADIYVHTAIEEPHGRAVIEAMAAGLPVVAFAVDGNIESVIDQHTGYLVPSGDLPALTKALLRLTSEPSARNRMGIAGRKRVETCFNATRTAQKIASVIEDNLPPLRSPFLKEFEDVGESEH